ncbi:MAG: zinc ribbon domain-containing protein [Anaerolineae bacterium]|jgi:putative FmdB family regulatory protein
MPVYEYRCSKCGEQFDKLVRSLSTQQNVECPHCGSEDLKKVISLFGVGGTTTSARDASCSTGSV